MIWIHNIKIKYKIILLTTIGGLGFFLYMLVNFNVAQENSERLQLASDVYYPVLEKTDSNIVRLDKVKEALNAAVGAGELDMLSEAEEHAGVLKNNLITIGKLNISLKAEAKNLNELFNEYFDTAMSLSRNMIDENFDEDMQNSISKMSASLAVLEEGLQSFRKNNHQHFISALEDSNIASVDALKLGLTTAIIIAIIVGSLTLLISTSISSNLKNVIEKLKDMNTGEGDLTQRLESKGNDEIGELVNSFNSFIERLDHTMSQALSNIDNLQLASTEISKSNNFLAQQTEGQAASLEETASSMEEMAATVKENAENSQLANKLANGASKQALEGGEVVGHAVTAMKQIQTSSGKVVEIISVIDEIAFQTNLLALNAAVEAARAGDQGRGFAVVASEVRSLAQRSAEAAKEIKVLIEDSVEKITFGSRTVNQSGDTLSSIVDEIKKVSEIVAEIANASREQSSGIDQVNSSMNHIEEIMQANTAQVEETAAASEAMHEQTENLVRLVSFFKTSNFAINKTTQDLPYDHQERHLLSADYSMDNA